MYIYICDLPISADVKEKKKMAKSRLSFYFTWFQVPFAEKTNANLFLYLLRQNCDVVQAWVSWAHTFLASYLHHYIHDLENVELDSEVQPLGAKQKTLNGFLEGILERGLWQRLPCLSPSPVNLCLHIHYPTDPSHPKNTPIASAEAIEELL